MTFDARPYLKELARGRHGARDLSRDQARELFGAILSGELDGPPLGAVLVALRIKGASLDLGVRNSGHTMAKLMLPMGIAPSAACRLVAVTHPDFLKLMREHFTRFPGSAFVMRGVEGEPVARLREAQPIEEMRSEG